MRPCRSALSHGGFRLVFAFSFPSYQERAQYIGPVLPGTAQELVDTVGEGRDVQFSVLSVPVPAAAEHLSLQRLYLVTNDIGLSGHSREHERRAVIVQQGRGCLYREEGFFLQGGASTQFSMIPLNLA